MTKDSCRREGMSRYGLTRRMVAGGTLFGLLGWFGLRVIGAGIGDAEAAILRLLGHDESASHIGRLALASWPEMGERSQLLSHILDDLELDAARAAKAGADALGTKISERIRMDFATGRTVALDGWLLSLAEVRLCALAALQNAGRIA